MAVEMHLIKLKAMGMPWACHISITIGTRKLQQN